MDGAHSEQDETFLNRAARLVSAAGHPLFTFSVFILFLSFSLYPLSEAIIISLLVIGVVVIPVTVRNYLKTRKGHYTNFDVSDRSQRQTFYPFLIALLTVAVICLYFFSGATNILIGTTTFLAMTVIASLVNRHVKCSLHTALSIYLAFSLWNVSFSGALLMFGFSVVIAWSRLILKRHTPSEVLTGAVLGLAFGAVLQFALQRFAV